MNYNVNFDFNRFLMSIKSDGTIDVNKFVDDKMIEEMAQDVKEKEKEKFFENSELFDDIES